MTKGLMTIATFRRRLRDESGHVGILMAMALFVVVGMLMMTWNTAQLSKEKMRLQNAADSAALGFCTWQARGMNAVQNINDEMYVALWVADKLLTFAIVSEGIALGLEKGERLPFVGPVFAFFSHVSHSVALLAGGTSGWLASRICPWVLRPLSYFYAYGSAALGWWGAQQFARLNGADPIANLSWTVGKWTLGFYAAGLSFPLRDTVLLPIEQKAENRPWKHKDRSKVFGKSKHAFYKKLHEFCGTGKAWEFKPWVSLTEKDNKGNEVPRTPGPSVWFAYRSMRGVETLSLDQWKSKASKESAFGSKVHSMPMFAVAAAQCISGDVVPHSKKAKEGEVNQRRAGFGTGATAKLIPVATALGALNKYVGKAVGVAIYH